MARSIKDEIKQAKPFGSLEQEAFVSLGRTWALLDHAFSEMLKPHGITPTQFNVLRILRGAGDAGLCRNDVIERMIAKVPDATRLLDRMEAAGLIDRRRDSVDRRYVTTRITEKGIQLLAELDEQVQDGHRCHFEALSRDEQKTLIELLARVRSAV